MRLVLRLASLCFRSPKTPSPLWDSLEATGIRPAFRFIAMYDGLAEPLDLIPSLCSSYTHLPMTKKIDLNKKKGGRPPMSEDERRQHPVKTGFNDIDHDTLVYRADSAGMSVSEFVHEAALNTPIRAHISDEHIEQVRGLTAMGNNLNQIARQANTSGLPSVIHLVKQILSDIQQLISRILRGGDIGS